MAATPLLERRRATIARALRCLSVPVGTTVLSAAVLVALTLGAGVPAGTANVIAVACGIGPSYVFNRRWAWQRDGHGSLAREVDRVIFRRRTAAPAYVTTTNRSSS
jgi:putative flippase GtrA